MLVLLEKVHTQIVQTKILLMLLKRLVSKQKKHKIKQNKEFKKFNKHNKVLKLLLKKEDAPNLLKSKKQQINKCERIKRKHKSTN